MAIFTVKAKVIPLFTDKSIGGHMKLSRKILIEICKLEWDLFEELYGPNSHNITKKERDVLRDELKSLYIAFNRALDKEEKLQS